MYPSDLQEEDVNEDDDLQPVNWQEGYRPYPNKLVCYRSYKTYIAYLLVQMMLLDIIDNLPRLRMSSSQFQIILWLLRQSGVAGVPAYGAFQRMQKELQALNGSSPMQHTSSIGNIFYTNDIGESVMQVSHHFNMQLDFGFVYPLVLPKDFAHPIIAEHIHLYPEETTGPVSEVWQFGRWKEFKPSELTPMFSRGLCQFFINELTQLKDGSYVIPQNLIIWNKKLTSDCNRVVVTPVSHQLVPISIQLIDIPPISCSIGWLAH